MMNTKLFVNIRLNDVISETGVETGILRTAQNHSEKILGTREMTNSYCTKIKGLEETVCTCFY